jgi:hypothetical protein
MKSFNWKRAALWSLPLLLILAAFVPVHGSSIATAAYGVIESAGTPVTQRSILNFVNGTTCVDNAGAARTDCTTGGSGISFLTINNASSTGTTLFTLTSLTTAPSAAVITSAGATGGVVGITINGAGTTGQATIAIIGDVGCQFDGATTANDYVQISASTAGNCHDAGATYPSAGQVIGRVLTTNGSGGQFSVDLFSSEIDPGGGAGSASRGTFASRSSCSASGSSYYSTDVAILSECNGSTWADWVLGEPVTLPSLTTFTGQNMAGGGGATLTTNGVIDMVTTGQSGDQLHGQFIALPSTPFTVDACFTLNTLTIGANILGLYVSDGTKLVTYQAQTNLGSNNFINLQIGYWNSVTSFNTGPVGVQPLFSGASQYCLRWNDNGTNVLFSVRVPPSATWWQFASLARTAFLTPTQIGWFMDSNQTTAVQVGNIFHWLQH